MNTEEKAKELLAKFEHEICFTDAKKCALIAVDEIIELDMIIDEDTYVMTPSYLQYWEQVKQEIEKL